jgi:hypothetical protein
MAKSCLKSNETTAWTTAAGYFTTSRTAKVQFTMPKLYEDNPIIEWKVHVAKDTGVYDTVIAAHHSSIFYMATINLTVLICL